MMTTYGVTDNGFVLKRLYDIRADMVAALGTVSDPTTGETLRLGDENDPLVQLLDATADALAAAWEQLQEAYNQFDPLKATGAGLSGLVQLNGLLRIVGEDDKSLRARQAVSTTQTSRGMTEDLYGALLNLPGMLFCRIYVNPTLVTDSRGLPGKSMAVVAVGGNDQDLGDTIWFKSPAGLELYGSTTVQHVDDQNISYDVGFTRPTPVVVYVAVAVTVVNSVLWPPDGADQIKQAIVDYAQFGADALGIPAGFDQLGFIPGNAVYASELYVPVNKVSGIRITSLKVGTAPAPASDVVDINWDEVASILVDNITVTVS